MKATLDQRQALIDLKACDSEIGKLRYELAHLPIYATIADLTESMTQADANVARIEADTEAATAEITARDPKISELAAQISRKQAQYESGEGMDSRQLLVIESEIATLTEAKDGLEGEQIEFMERLEELEGAYTEATGHRAGLDTQLTEATAEKNSIEADYASKIAAATARRDQFAEIVGQSILAAYDESRALGGAGVVVMDGDGSVDGGMDLSVTEINEINALDPDELYLTEDTGAIVLRSAHL